MLAVARSATPPNMPIEWHEAAGFVDHVFVLHGAAAIARLVSGDGPKMTTAAGTSVSRFGFAV